MNNLMMAIILVEIIATLSLGGLVFLQNTKSSVARSFFLMAILGAVWIPLGYFGGNVEDESLSELFIKGDYVVGLLVMWSFWLFTDAYKRNVVGLARYSAVIKFLVFPVVSIFSVAVMAFMFVDSNTAINSSVFMTVYAFVTATLILLGASNLFYAKKASAPNDKKRTSLIFASLVGTLLLVVIPFIIAEVFPEDSGAIEFLQQISASGSLIFISVTAYAMIKHRLFDIRAAIARSITYMLALIAMLAIYAGLVFGATLIFFEIDKIDVSQFMIFALLAVFLAFTHQPLKKFFDKFTDAIFYRQSYDSEKVLNEYSDFLVDEVETDEIINHTLKMLNSALNPESAYVVLYRNGAGEWYDGTGIILGDARDAMARALEYQKPSILTSDLSSIREDEFTKNIKDHLTKENIRLSVRLSTHGQLEGFILLGEKKNGSRYSPDDYKFLTTVANELSVSLQNSERFDEIEKFNKTLKEQIEAATKQLRESNRKLQSLDQAKDEFISMASHQLRTPLTSIKGYVSMIMDGDAGPVTDDQRRLLGEAFASSQRMVYLISDLLNVSRLKTGKFIIEKTSVNLPKMVEQEVNQLIPSAETRNLTLSYAPPTRFPELMIDETKTRQVVMNFIDNAIYYTKSGGQIEVNLRVNKNQIEYRVKDSGIGVPTRDQHKLFTKFFRAHNARNARPDGTGLGLYMAQKIITAQGGSIHFESKEGKGSEFGFNLPLSNSKVTSKKSNK